MPGRLSVLQCALICFLPYVTKTDYIIFKMDNNNKYFSTALNFHSNSQRVVVVDSDLVGGRAEEVKAWDVLEFRLVWRVEV